MACRRPAKASGASALLPAAVLDVGPGDEVIVPPDTFVATAVNRIQASGAAVARRLAS